MSATAFPGVRNDVRAIQGNQFTSEANQQLCVIIRLLLTVINRSK